MQTIPTVVAILICFQLKHFVADYLLQPAWIISAKADPRRAGGYVHAGIHAFGSLPAFLIAGFGAAEACVLMMAEFSIHYLIDFAKARLSCRIHAGPHEQAYWSLHGGDQLMHQLTYAGLIMAAVIF